MKLLVKKRRKVIINITSLIDVLFLLLIFFMVSSTFLEQPGMKLELPETKTSTQEKIKNITVEMMPDGDLFVNGNQMVIDDLEQKFKELLPSLEEESLILKADKRVAHGEVVKVMDIAKLSGLKKIVIATKIETSK